MTDQKRRGKVNGLCIEMKLVEVFTKPDMTQV